jgi:hypothetical protein
MKVELLLDPNSPEYQDIVDGLKDEFAALEGLEYTQVTEPAPPRTLAVDHNVLKFVFEHPQTVNLVTALIQLTRSVIERIGVRPKKDVPQAVIVVKERSLKLPASPGTEKRFVSNLGKPQKSVVRPSTKQSKKLTRKVARTISGARRNRGKKN